MEMAQLIPLRISSGFDRFGRQFRHLDLIARNVVEDSFSIQMNGGELNSNCFDVNGAISSSAYPISRQSFESLQKRRVMMHRRSAFKRWFLRSSLVAASKNEVKLRQMLDAKEVRIIELESRLSKLADDEDYWFREYMQWSDAASRYWQELDTGHPVDWPGYDIAPAGRWLWMELLACDEYSGDGVCDSLEQEKEDAREMADSLLAGCDEVRLEWQALKDDCACPEAGKTWRRTEMERYRPVEDLGTKAASPDGKER
ncbi:hypothetical protein LCGC14_2891900 [marine sediment metagenome]|uniref:Uncharacterized protein n=1 Tax=marine sediment metagenome TaxID=412755 RepID=A0A0F8XXB3_9ZZZZ